ncbi:hypothetical protein [Sinorhizobium meliloti]|uniref:hypothetical protein n=1 Tax=Rhizobium meliloti TaxID=382 RepID=UPI001F24EE90|nr:hypothetical protein [Sinorhizobium meliloti]
MPFIEERRVAQNLSNIAPVDQPDDPTLAETFGAAFRTENIVGSFLSSRGMPDPYEVEEGFNAIDYVKDDPEFSPYVDQFAGVFNKRAADAKKLQIKNELADQRTLASAGGMGLVASMAAGVFDLPTLLPIGGGALGAGAVRAARGAAIGAGIDAAVSEGGLQFTQTLRTGEQTAFNIGGSIILGGALGTLAGRYLSSTAQGAVSRKIQAQEKGFEEFDQAFSGTGKATSGGSAARDSGPLTLKDEAIIRRIPIANQQDPLIRLQLSDYDTARQAVRGLAETPLEYADNAAGVATELGGSVETRMKMWNAPLAESLTGIDTTYAKYFHNVAEPSAWQTRLSPVRSEFARATGGQKLTYKQFKEEVGKAAFSDGKHAIPEVAEAAAYYRSIDEAMKKAAIEAKLFPEDVAVAGDVSHLFRMYNKNKIIAHRNDFGRILNDYFIAKREGAAKAVEGGAKATDAKAAQELDDFSRLTDAEIKNIVEETIDNILGNAEGRIPYDSIVSGPRGPLKERLLKIESAKIQDFLELDIEDVLHAQVRTMSADVELARKFGSVDLKEEIRKINDEANAKIDKATTAAERTRLDKQRKDAIRDVEGIRDRLRGQYALPANPDGLVLRAGRVARNLNYLRLLGGMTISAIPDMGKVVFTHGLTSTFRDGFIPMIRNFKGFRLAAREVKQAGTALDMILDSRAMALADITGDFGRHSKFERGIKAMSSRFGVASLMAPWNASMKQFAGLVTMTNVLKASQRVANGTATEKDITRLAASSINEDLAKRIAAQFSKHGDEQDGILLAKAADWSDRSAREAFRAAVVRDVDRIIVTPGQDKPLWMSTELGKTIGQFKSFGISSMQRTALAGLQQRDAATLNGVLVMLGLGAMTYWAKQTASGQPLSDNPAQWAVEAFDKSGLTGYLMEANNMSEKLTRGRVGFSALTGEQVSRYASRNVTGAFLGPTPDAIADIFQISGSIFAGDTTKADLRKARQLIPGQNLFYFRELFNQVEGATGEALGLPDTRK